MPGIFEFRSVVQGALDQYGDIFANECQRRHFAYLTGLIVAERKTVLGINGEFAQTTDQSCPNRFLTAADWDVQKLNERRLEELQKDPSTRYSDQGVIPIGVGGRKSVQSLFGGILPKSLCLRCFRVSEEILSQECAFGRATRHFSLQLSPGEESFCSAGWSSCPEQ